MQNMIHTSPPASWRQWLPWLLFAGVCVQLTFQWPYAILVPGTRANVFSGLLCALAFLGLWLLRPPPPAPRRGELIVSLSLLGLIAASGALSVTPLSSSLRGFVLIASGLGGFWSARLLLTDQAAARRFQWLCCLLLAGVLGLSFLGYALAGEVRRFFDPNRHPLPALILLLGCGPCNLAFTGSRPEKIWGAALLSLGYFVLLLSKTVSAILLPFILLPLMALGHRAGRKMCLLLLLLISLITLLSSPWLPWHRLQRDSHSLYFRLENVPFSWEIARRHPFLGNGLCAPRTGYLEDYTFKYPYVPLTKKEFAGELAGFHSSDSIFLTFLADLGLPFLLIYLGALVFLFRDLFATLQAPGRSRFFHPWALALPLIGSLLYYQVFDGLLFPALAWFFHLLLGLIPRAPAGGRPPENAHADLT